MDQQELDSMIRVIENPVRRRIMKRLSQEPCYALQLSKELGLGQPLVAKHLAVMEQAGLVTTTMETSPSGPRRKRFSLARGISITMDVGPNLFIQRGTTFEGELTPRRGAGDAERLGRMIRDASSISEPRERMSRISEILAEVDSKMDEVEEERTGLLAVRNLAMHEAARVASTFDEPDKRRVLFHVLDEHDMAIERISEALNLREFSVKSILDELEAYID